MRKGKQMNMLEQANILLVEDDLGDQKLIKKSFEMNHIANDLHILNCAEEAVEYLNRSKEKNPDYPIPDLILLDLNMPGMGGKEFLKWLKNDKDFDTIPTVVLTASDTDADILESYKLAASGYVSKPINLEGFKQIIESMTEYWFVICKRVLKPRTNSNESNKCLASG